MKKIITFCLVTLLAFSFGTMKSQDTLKPFTNKWATELNFNPFDGSFSLNNANGQIKIRKFNANSTAIRMAITINYKQDNSNVDNPYGMVPVHTEDKRKSLLIALNLGQEKHFAGSRRVSPYIGYDVGAGLKMSEEKIKTSEGEREIKGAWLVNASNYPYNAALTERGFWSLGVNAITGIDFYIVKNFYVGCEIAFGLDYINYTNIEIEDYDQDAIPYPDIDNKSLVFGPKLLNGLRIGYVF